MTASSDNLSQTKGDPENYNYYGDNYKTVNRTNDVTQVTTIQSKSETVTFSAGAAGTTGVTVLGHAPVYDSIGAQIGSFVNSSLVWTTGTVLTTEVNFRADMNETDFLATLTNGKYAVDYDTGKIYYCKATTGTSDTATYKVRGQVISLGGATIDVALDADNDNVEVYGVYNATEPTLTDGDKAPLQLNENGELKVTGGAGASSVSAEYISPSDFTATYTSSSSITLSGVPISINDSSQIAYIKQVKADNTSRTYVNGANDITLAYSAGVITIYEKGVVVTSLASGDVYEVGINGTTKAYDLSTDANKTISLVNVWNRYTDPEVLVTAQDLTDAYADYGAVIDMRGYTHLGVYIVTDVNASENATLKLLGKHTSEGTDEFELNGGTTQALWTTAASDAKVHYEFDVKGAPFIQLQAIAGTVGATPGDLTVYITKQFKN